MGAETIWNVKVLKSYEETVEIEAVTRNEAANIAASNPDVIRVLEVEWKDTESNQGAESSRDKNERPH